MTLAPQLFDRRFDDLMEIGRAKLRSLAPTWTDHNAHDPGITIMELLAWNAEAQMYALSRMRRDERAAYAALMGLRSTGNVPAEGILWSTRHLSSSASVDLTNRLLLADAIITVDGLERPRFTALDRLLLIAGSIMRVQSRSLRSEKHASGIAQTKSVELPLGDAMRKPLVRSSRATEAPVYPFGKQLGNDRVLRIEVECRDPNGLLGNDPDQSRTGRLALGVVAPVGRAGSELPYPHAMLSRFNTLRPELAATLYTDGYSVPLDIVSDTSFGMLQTGVLLFDLSAIELSSINPAPRQFAIELSAPSGFPRPPRITRLELNAIPIVQGQAHYREMHLATGLPDWSLQLEEFGGLQFAAGKPAVRIEVEEEGKLTEWICVERLSDWGPRDKVFECESSSGIIQFGNGINGRSPRTESFVYATYRVCDGAGGNVARNRKWRVPGFRGSYGSNVMPIAHGQDARFAFESRREARESARRLSTLVTEQDIVTAALQLPFLEVRQAWIALAHPNAPKSNVVHLIVRRDDSEAEEDGASEATEHWLASVRRMLAPLMPLGTRLLVSTPRVTAFSLKAEIAGMAGRQPDVIRGQVVSALRFQLVALNRSPSLPGALGPTITLRDLAAIILTVPGVETLVSLELFNEMGQIVSPGAAGESASVSAGADGVLQWHEDASVIEVHSRSATGGQRAT